MARRRARSAKAVARIGVVALGVSACGHEACLALPCPLPLAFEIAVTDSSSPGPLSGVTMALSGAVTGGGPCNQASSGATCFVLGYAGTYEIDVSAPGYRSAHRQVTVTGTSPACGCASTDPQRLTLTLARAG